MAFDITHVFELLEMNEPAQALTALKKARKKDAQVLFLQGESHRQLGSFETALRLPLHPPLSRFWKGGIVCPRHPRRTPSTPSACTKS